MNSESSVAIFKISAANALALKYELESDGLRMGVDFDWEYNPVKYTSWLDGDREESCAKYTFNNSNLASFYRLKWIK